MTECVGRGRRAAGRAQGMAGEVVASSWRVRLLHTRRGWGRERRAVGCRLPRPGTCGGISTALAPAAASVLLLPHGRNHRRAGDLARAARVWGAAPVGCRTLARSRARGRTSVLGHAEAIAGAGAGQDAGARAPRHMAMSPMGLEVSGRGVFTCVATKATTSSFPFRHRRWRGVGATRMAALPLHAVGGSPNH